MGILAILAKALAVAFGQRLADRLATELVIAVAKGCPKKVDKLAAEAKAKQDAEAEKTPD